MAEPTETLPSSADVLDEKLENEIISQFEQYLSDENLSLDKELLELVQRNNCGWIPIYKLCKRPELEQYDEDTIKQALKKGSDKFELNRTGRDIRRAKPLPKPPSQFSRSIYAKGFPEETPELEAKLLEFFGQFGEVEQVRFRREKETDAFKGSVFVEYKTLEEANRVAAMELKYEETDLLLMTKAAYCAMKEEQLGICSIPMGEEKKPFKYKRGCLLQFSNAGPETQISSVKDALDFEVNFVKLDKELNRGIIELKEPLSDEALESLKANSDILFDGTHPEFDIVKDEEENQYYMDKILLERRKESRGHGRGRGRGGRGGRGRGSNRGRGNFSNKRKPDNQDQDTKSKVQKKSDKPKGTLIEVGK